MKPAPLLRLLCALLPLGAFAQPPLPAERVVAAYVTSWTERMPDPAVLTHVNYAFGHVNESCDGVRIDNPDRLRAIAALKAEHPHLKVLLSIGGWGSGRFSEMAADRTLRARFAADCRRAAEEFSLDGIDIDWEYPTSSVAGISASRRDKRNFTRLMADLRAVLGADRLLTFASSATARYVQMRRVARCVDFINVMTYDMGVAPYHHSALYRSPMCGDRSCHEAIVSHLKKGVPAHKLVLGIPFYGRGRYRVPKGIGYERLQRLEGVHARWDEQALAPYLVDEQGAVVCTYDDPRSIAHKCAYVREHGLRGAMYWEYAGDDEAGTLQRAVWRGLMQAP